MELSRGGSKRPAIFLSVNYKRYAPLKIGS